MKILQLTLACVAITAIFASTLRLLNTADKPNVMLLFIDDWA